jgi:hypothetical protein
MGPSMGPIWAQPWAQKRAQSWIQHGPERYGVVCLCCKVPADMRARIVAWARTWLSSEVHENGNRILRKASRASDNGAMSRFQRWNRVVKSNVLYDHGRAELPVTGAAKKAASGVIRTYWTPSMIAKTISLRSTTRQSWTTRLRIHICRRNCSMAAVSDGKLTCKHRLLRH